MLNRRETLMTLAATGVALAADHAFAASALAASGPLSWTAFPAGEAGFLRAPVLLTGPTEALLIDGGFTYADGRAVADAIRATGKRLTTIVVTVNDPDYYFSLNVLRQAFPEARIIAAAETVELIRRKVEGKLKVWSPKLGDNGPRTVDEVVFPTATEETVLSVDGQPVEIVTVPGMKDRRYLWVPSLRAVFGGVLSFGGLHPWTADTPTPAERAAWVQALDGIAARDPAVVVPGHLRAGWPLDASAVAHTRDYLLAYEAEVAKAADSAALIAAMKRLYPDAGLGIALEIGAKVAKGEMKWG
ncbi:MBL fold metallo-hydrolase [Azospirillum sp. RWY-5-1]|uniref:MBL fold metallo-hydrolase n=1 Tax=Azospirillum oleiclasticum TaxID=2735135 RepID=A0ABX2TID5_9PROT|nr:MBL fold metallo-hydrolase [Azospirillum oleiclasticum]NYZ16062.1 MBL fold metallo-hydrolase [Azospirillum oleiclasticum]NYZ22943.1 MBL fold metallo-hydrolase [Azospirillum oleiclasticum]